MKNNSIYHGNSIAAIIVLYNPDISILNTLIESIYDSVDHIILMDNSEYTKQGIMEAAYRLSKLVYVFNDGNCGIASALNLGISKAISLYCEFIITFDQDSCPSSDMVKKLLDSYLEIASHSGDKIGAVGPALVDSRNGNLMYPFLVFKRLSGFLVDRIYPNPSLKYEKVDLLITSGMLFSSDLWKIGFKFMDELFIDYVDTEWCLRTGAAGYKHYGCADVRMYHSVSDAPGKRIMGILLLKYSPLRRYFYYRNTLIYVGLAYAPIGNRIRMLLGAIVRLPFIAFIDDRPISSYRQILRGFFDGLRIVLNISR